MMICILCYVGHFVWCFGVWYHIVPTRYGMVYVTIPVFVVRSKYGFPGTQFPYETGSVRDKR